MTEALLDLAAVERLVRERAQGLDAREESFPSFGRSRDFGDAHIEIDDRYHWVTVERGRELERRTTADLDELLYWIFSSITWDLASAYEMNHRRGGVDTRRLLFAKHIELLDGLDIAWGSRKWAELAAIVAQHPFADHVRGADDFYELVPTGQWESELCPELAGALGLLRRDGALPIARMGYANIKSPELVTVLGHTPPIKSVISAREALRGSPDLNFDFDGIACRAHHADLDWAGRPASAGPAAGQSGLPADAVRNPPALLYRCLLGIDAITLLVLLFFFVQGLGDGTVSAFNIGLWLLILIGPVVLIAGGYALRQGGNRVLANLVLAVLAIPAFLFALLMGLLIFTHPRWN
jgi:hypothetical protein